MKKRYSFINLKIGELVNGFFVSSSRWGYIRLYLFIVLIWGYIWISNILFGLNKALEIAESIHLYLPLLQVIPIPFLAIPIVLFYPVAGWKFLLIPIGMIGYCLWLCSKYVKEIHSFKTSFDGILYLCASVFAVFLPKAVAQDTLLKGEEDRQSWLSLSGEGPGYLIVHPNNAIILEKLGSLSSFLAAGKHYLSRFEKVAVIIDLKDRMVVIPKMSVMTSDRVVLDVDEFCVWYRISSTKRETKKTGGVPLNPYPYSIDALRSQHYNLFISKEGKTNWETMVVNICKSQIIDFINRNDYDTITSLNEEKLSRDKSIQTILDSPEARQALWRIGTEIIRHDFIEVNISDDFMVDPKLNIWEDKWKGKAMITQAEGEAQKLAYQEFAMNEEKINFLNELGIELQNVDFNDNTEANIQNIMMRIKDVTDQTFRSKQ